MLFVILFKLILKTKWTVIPCYDDICQSRNLSVKVVVIATQRPTVFDLAWSRSGGGCHFDLNYKLIQSICVYLKCCCYVNLLINIVISDCESTFYLELFWCTHPTKIYLSPYCIAYRHVLYNSVCMFLSDHSGRDNNRNEDSKSPKCWMQKLKRDVATASDHASSCFCCLLQTFAERFAVDGTSPRKNIDSSS